MASMGTSTGAGEDLFEPMLVSEAVFSTTQSLAVGFLWRLQAILSQLTFELLSSKYGVRAGLKGKKPAQPGGCHDFNAFADPASTDTGFVIAIGARPSSRRDA
jgi:hypothetical protein